MMSMGSLGHYMHDLVAAGFGIGDFLHEGNGEIWNFAVRASARRRRLDRDRGTRGRRRRAVRQARIDPRFLSGYRAGRGRWRGRAVSAR